MPSGPTHTFAALASCGHRICVSGLSLPSIPVETLPYPEPIHGAGAPFLGLGVRALHRSVVSFRQPEALS